MQAFVKEIQRLNECKNYGRALYLLCNPPFKWEETCAEDRILLEVMRAQAHKKCGNIAASMRICLAIQDANNDNVWHLLCQLCHELANYDTALMYLQRKRAPASDQIEALQSIVTHASYADGRPEGALCLCKCCGNIAPNLLLCDCKRAWYCNETCRASDAAVHAASPAHARMQLDLIPADVVITYILPFCFTTITIRRLAIDYKHWHCHFGLQLRTLSRHWRRCVDGCVFFWTRIVAKNWPLHFRPNPREEAALTRDTVCAFMLARARLYCVSVLKRKRSVISGTQRNIKREIEMLEGDHAQKTAELATLDARFKKLKDF
jgi:hypothetical protein